MSCPTLDNPNRSRNWKMTPEWSCPVFSNYEPKNHKQKCNFPDQQVALEKPSKGTYDRGRDCPFTTAWYFQPFCSKADDYKIDTDTLWNCCTNDNDKYNCHPDFCVNSDSCKTFLNNNCTGDIILGVSGSPLQKNTCLDWCTKNPSECINRKKNYCKSKDIFAISEDCKIFAKEMSNNNDPFFDLTVGQYCLLHPNELYCSCTKIPDTTGIKQNDLIQLLKAPHCYDSKCISQGYKNTNQRNATCPPTTVCNNSVNLAELKDINLGNITQSCNASMNINSESTTVKKTNTIPGNAPAPAPPPPPPPPPPKFDKKKVGIVLGFILFILVIFGIVKAFSSDSPKKGGYDFILNDID